ncbi:MAG: HAMP domain-containing histidine kinase [Terrimonas ferruginea]|jgi:hypothetical protein|uniref:hypothetical protein n=1 Tax=Terrimonas ferruginea TaxID=249 RepID=UPI000AA4BEA4|nr:hypothetical protein [Terrimonas ferruginea]MBN8784821.1 HAMP domain-containing histidine kinase [Terrimonas ferruginea]
MTNYPDSRRPLFCKVSLKGMIDHLVSGFLVNSQGALNNLINEMPEEPLILVDEKRTGHVIRELLTAVVTNARNGDIHIRADLYPSEVCFQVEERNNYNGCALASRICYIQTVAGPSGGYISHQGDRQLVTTISYHFPLS